MSVPVSSKCLCRDFVINIFILYSFADAVPVDRWLHPLFADRNIPVPVRGVPQQNSSTYGFGCIKFNYTILKIHKFTLFYHSNTIETDQMNPAGSFFKTAQKDLMELQN